MGTRLLTPALKLLLAILAAAAFAPTPARAGCAIAIEIKPNGSFGTYSENASDPKFGHHYITAAQAVSLLMDGLKKQDITDAQLIFQSDQTGYFSLAVGHAQDGTLLNNVGCAARPMDADKQALAALKARGVTDGEVVNRFFSYGDPAAGGPGGSPH
jgi:hypothetical protein